MLRKLCLLAVLATLAAGLAGCGEQTPGQGKPVAKVNGYVISEDAFRRRIAATVKMYGKASLSQKDKLAYLEQEISKELLIQEAIKQGLEKKDSFRERIQSYWEQVLISDLLAQKARAMADKTFVTEEELAAAGQKAGAGGAAGPQTRRQLARALSERKKAAALEAWMEGLRKKAKVTIYRENLEAMR